MQHGVSFPVDLSHFDAEDLAGDAALAPFLLPRPAEAESLCDDSLAWVAEARISLREKIEDDDVNLFWPSHRPKRPGFDQAFKRAASLFTRSAHVALYESPAAQAREEGVAR